MPARSLCARLCPAGIRAAVAMDVVVDVGAGAGVFCTASGCISPAAGGGATLLYQSVGDEGSPMPLVMPMS